MVRIGKPSQRRTAQAARLLLAGLTTTVGLVLTACGGGSDSASASTSSSSSTACSTGNRSGLVAMGLYGDVGTASVTSGGAQISTNFGTSTTRTLIADSAAPGVCADASGGATMRTAFVPGGATGMTHASIGAIDQPVFLLSGSTLATSLGSLAGTFNLLRYQKETPNSGGSAATRSSYATMVIDNSGNWYFCKNTNTCSSGSPTGSGTINVRTGSPDRFDLVANSIIRGTVFLADTGGARVLVVGEDDQGDPNGRVRGLWIGAPQAAWAANDGSYTLNTTDFGKDSLRIAGTVITANSTITAAANSPLQGLLTATPSGGNNNYILQAAGGLMVTANNAGNNFGTGPGYFSFGVKP